MTQTTYRVAAIGCGRKGTEHARAYMLNPAAEVVAAADPDPENLELFRKRFGLSRGYSDYQEMLRKEKIDIASAILPVNINPSVVLGCAQADVKAICCEKPISTSLEDADQMVHACQSRGIKLASGDLERNLPEYRKAWETISSGEVGELRGMTFHSGSGTQMSGGGCQVFSLMRMFAGDADVGWVAGDPASDHDQGVAGYVRFVNGVEAFIHRDPNARNGFEVLCSRGVFHSDGQHLSLRKTAEGTDLPTSASLQKVEGILPDGPVRRGGPGTRDEEGWEQVGTRQVATVQRVIDSLETGVDSGGSGDNGRKVLEMAIAMRESHRRGHAPVRLPLQDRSLRIIPIPGRMWNKKEVHGEEWYAQQIGRYKDV